MNATDDQTNAPDARRTPARDTRDATAPKFVVRRARKLGAHRAYHACRACVCAASLALALCGCSRDPQKEVRQELQTLSSWAATLHLLADAWREGSVPTRYAEISLENAREALQEESRSVQSSSSLNGDARATLSAHLQSLDALAVALAGAVESGDRAQGAALAGQVSREEQSLSDLARGVGAR